MSPRLRRLSARQVLQVFQELGFQVAGTRGSRVKLRRERPDGSVAVLTIPFHREIAPGTLRAIHRQALRYIPEAELRFRFTS
jgi:predicted RNA binding protein YcfA (HicA-like mRNA interferase family)